MNEQELTKDESLALITEMIGQAKSNIAKGGSFYFLLWGWVVLIAHLGHYLIGAFDWLEYPYIVWVITIPAAIVSVIHGARQGRAAKVKSHLDGLYGKVWLAVGIGILIVIVFGAAINYNITAIILALAGVGTYISGSMLRFKPLIVGAVALWCSSVVAFNVSMLDQNLVGMVGIFAGYLIPGYLLKKAESERV